MGSGQHTEQKADSRREQDESLDWLLGWCLLTVACAYMGSWIGKQLTGLLPAQAAFPTAVFEGLCRGGCLGLGQWFLLRGKLRAAVWWIVVNALGFSLFSFGQEATSSLSRLSGAIELVLMTLQGGLVGLIQWTYLHRRFEAAHWWVASCAGAAFIQYLIVSLVGLLAPSPWLLDGLGSLTWAGVCGYAMLVYLDRLHLQAPEQEQRLDSIRTQTNHHPAPNQSPKYTDHPHEPAYRQRPVHQKPRQHPASQPTTAPVGSPTTPIPPGRVTPQSAGADNLPSRLVLTNRKVQLTETHEHNTTAAIFDFNLTKRPRRARLRMRYSGVSVATQAHFRQHVQLNGTVLATLQPNDSRWDKPAEYLLPIPQSLFARTNRLIFVSRSDGTMQKSNPFQLHSVLLEFES